MAVIQDLPPELLLKIIEHGINHKEENEESSNSQQFRNTSLVARAWTTPSQELLVYTSSLSRVVRFLEGDIGTLSATFRVKKLVVSRGHSRELGLLGRSLLLVEQL